MFSKYLVLIVVLVLVFVALFFANSYVEKMLLKAAELRSENAQN
jgi:hypothetical protein